MRFTRCGATECTEFWARWDTREACKLQCISVSTLSLSHGLLDTWSSLVVREDAESVLTRKEVQAFQSDRQGVRSVLEEPQEVTVATVPGCDTLVD